MKVFISYSRRDSNKKSLTLGKNLAKFLVARNIDVVFDELSFRHSATLAQEMIDGIYSSDKFILLASQEALKSKHVETELKFAKDRSIQLHPSSFIHVVCLTDKLQPDSLPKDLSASLCHIAYGKSHQKLFYEVFLSLHGILFGDLIKKIIKHNPESDWAMLERYQKVDILNKKGDVKVSTLRSVMNITDRDLKYSNNINIWAYGKTKSLKLDVKATNEFGGKLESKIVRSADRGDKTTKCTIQFQDPIAPDDIFTFRTEYIWPVGFDLTAGDSYTLDCHDMVYGYLRVDFYFPRAVKPIVPTVTITKKKVCKPRRINNLGFNKYYYSKLYVLPGTKYEFNLKLKES